MERDVLAGLGRAEQNAGVLLRKEPFGNDDEQIAGRDHRADEGEQRGEAVAQHEIDAALVAVGERNEALLAEVIEPPVPLLVVALEKARRHHRGEGQRDEGRDEDRHRDRDREFAEQAADDAAHHQERNQHRDQRDGDRYDGEADLGRALERRLKRLFALFDVARDVLEHHDRVVDDEADGDGEGHQRQIVEAVACDPHERTGAEQRERHRNAGNDRRPDVAQEDEDHHHHERDGEREGELDVAHGGADGRGAVGENADVNGRRDRSLQGRQRALDRLDRVDDVRAGDLVHDEKDARLAIAPGRLRRVLRSRDRLADVAHAHRRPVAIGDDDVVPVLGLGQLVVVLDGEGLLRSR